MDSKLVKKLRPYLLMVFLLLINAVFAILAKAALNKGSSHFTFAVYRNVFAAIVFIPFAFFIDRKTRPKMTIRIFIKILVLGLLDPVIAQNLFYTGLKFSTPTFTAAMCNLIPAITFVLAWVLRIEKVNLREIRSHAKILGTLIVVSGAMILSLVKGSVLPLPWTHKPDATASANPNNQLHPVKGALMVTAAYLASAFFYILQSITLRSYPTSLSLTAWICTIGALLGTVLTFTVERGNTEIWVLGWNAKLLAYVYGGVVSSGITYYVSGIIMKDKGPVFVTAFSPFSMVIVAVMSSFIFAEQMTVGKVVGAMVIVIGLYTVLWGKSRDKPLVVELQQQKTSSPEKPEKEDVGPEKILGHNVV